MQKLKTNDEIIVLAGRDKGKRGKITRVMDNGRAMVTGINIVKKHTKPNPNMGVAGGIVEKEAPVQLSNIAIFNSASNKADRVGFKVLEDGKKVRIFKSNQEMIDA